MLGLELQALWSTEIEGIILGMGLAISRTPDDLRLVESTMVGVLLLISSVLELHVTLQALQEPPGLQIVELEGMGADSDALGDPLASSLFLDNSACTLVNSACSGSPLGSKNSIPDSVRALGGFTRSGSRSETGGLVLLTGMAQEGLVTMGDGARRGGRVRNEWRAV